VKNILGSILFTISLTANALTCTSTTSDSGKTIELIQKDQGVILFEINAQEQTSFLLGSTDTNVFFQKKYTAYDHLGAAYSFSVSEPIQHCRARICHNNPFAPLLGILSSQGIDNEYFDCL
jgi:hypothetical protein